MSEQNQRSGGEFDQEKSNFFAEHKVIQATSESTTPTKIRKFSSRCFEKIPSILGIIGGIYANYEILDKFTDQNEKITISMHHRSWFN